MLRTGFILATGLDYSRGEGECTELCFPHGCTSMSIPPKRCTAGQMQLCFPPAVCSILEVELMYKMA